MKLVLDNLACDRGGRRLFSGLSRELKAGQGLLVKGPNGSGKSTLLKTIAGLLQATSGTIALEGGLTSASVSEQCHLVGHQPGVKRALSVAENFAFWRDFLGGDGGLDGLARLGLADLADLPAGVLSAGQRRRLALARLLAAPRTLWLLDEPAEALDRASNTLLGKLIDGQLAKGGIVVAVSHTALGGRFTRSLTLGGVPAARSKAAAR
jgi:heme exporter protein A